MIRSDLSNSDDIIDIRNVIERIEEIENEQNSLVEEYKEARDEEQEALAKEPERGPSERITDAINALSSFWDIPPEEVDDSVHGFENPTDGFNGDEEAATLRAFIEQFRGYGGDHQWEGSWFPVTFIRDSYFEEFAEEFAADIGAIDPDAHWPANCIDWEKAASELQIDYTSGEFDGVTYWAR